MPSPTPGAFPCGFLPLPCYGGWLGAPGCSPEPAKAMPTTALPAQHLHTSGSSWTARDPWDASCYLELHSWASFSRMRLQALFPWSGTLQETTQLLWELGGLEGSLWWLFHSQNSSCCHWFGAGCSCAAQLSPLGPSGFPPHPTPGWEFQEHNRKLIPAWVLAQTNKTWDYNSQERHLESSYPS